MEAQLGKQQTVRLGLRSTEPVLVVLLSRWHSSALAHVGTLRPVLATLGHLAWIQSRIILGTKDHSGLILYVNKIDGYQYDSPASNGYGTYCRFCGGCKKSLQNMSPKLTKLIRHFTTRRYRTQARLFCDSRLHRCSYPTVTNRALPESASISLPRSSERSAQRCASC